MKKLMTAVMATLTMAACRIFLWTEKRDKRHHCPKTYRKPTGRPD